MTHPLTPREKVAAAIIDSGVNIGSSTWPDDIHVDALRLADAILTALASGSGDHAELARLAEAATPGPWQNGYDDLEGVVSLGSTDDGNVVCFPPDDRMELSFSKWSSNAAFIAAASPATVLALLAENAALGSKLDDVSEQCSRWIAAHDEQSERATEAERKLAEAVEHGRKLLYLADGGPSTGHKVHEWTEAARDFLSKEAERG